MGVHWNRGAGDCPDSIKHKALTVLCHHLIDSHRLGGTLQTAFYGPMDDNCNAPPILEAEDQA